MKKVLLQLGTIITFFVLIVAGWCHSTETQDSSRFNYNNDITKQSVIVATPFELIGYWHTPAPSIFLELRLDNTLEALVEGQKIQGTYEVSDLVYEVKEGKEMRSFNLTLSVPTTTLKGTHKIEISSSNDSYITFDFDNDDFGAIHMNSILKEDYDFAVASPIKNEEFFTASGIEYSSITYSIPGSEDGYSIQYLQFNNLENKVAQKTLNLALDPRYQNSSFDQSIIAPWRCRGVLKKQNLDWISDDLISITNSSESECYGPYPDSWSYSQVYDLRTGKELKFSALFNGAEAYYFIKEKYLSSDLSDDCSSLYNYPESSVVYGLRDDEIIVHTVMPHVCRAEEVEVTIPLNELAPYIHKESRLYSLL